MTRQKAPYNVRDPNGIPIHSAESQWKMRASKVGDSVIHFIGYARPGTAESEAAWVIAQNSYDSEGDMLAKDWAGGKFYFDNVWDSGRSLAIEGATSADPVVITITNHGLENGTIIRIEDVGGETELNDGWFKIANKTANTFELQTLAGVNVDGSGYGAYTSGGVVYIPEFANYDFS